MFLLMILLAGVNDSQLHSGVDCGPLCVHEVLKYYELETDYQILRMELLRPEHIDGASVGQVIAALENRQVPTRLTRVSTWEDTIEENPSIILTELSTGEMHFVIAFKDESGVFRIWDPTTRDIVHLRDYGIHATPLCRISTHTPGQYEQRLGYYALVMGTITFLFLAYRFIRNLILIWSLKLNNGGQNDSFICSSNVC